MIELSSPNEECRRQMAERILADCQEYIELMVIEGVRDSAAQFQERCIKIALSEKFNNEINIEPKPAEVEAELLPV